MDVRAALDALGMHAVDPWDRFGALPRRVIDCEHYAGPPAFVPAVDAWHLKPVQNAALHELYRARGLFAAIGVGHGKTLIAWLAPLVVGARRTVYLAPASMHEHTRSEWARYAAAYPRDSGPDVLLSYARLSNEPDVLERLGPDLIVADEAHRLRNQAASRTATVAQYLEARPDTVVVALSGTMTTAAVSDYAHLLGWAAGEAAPVPEGSILNALDLVVGGGLEDPPPWAWQKMRGLERLVPCERTREGYRRAWRDRLVQTPGVVATSSSSCDATLVLNRIEAPEVKAIEEALTVLDDLWELPDGTPLSSPAHVSQAASLLSCGFYYRPIWEGGEPDRDWLRARRKWGAAVRDYLGNDPPLDVGTEARIRRACAEGAPPSAFLADAWRAWAPHHEREPVRRESVMISDDRIEWVASWVDAAPGRCAWAYHRAPEAQLHFATASDAVYSIPRDGTGRNLQAYREALLLEVPANGSTWEQLIGRLHRKGQTADAVVFHWIGNRWNDARLRRSTAHARYIEQTTGARQLLLAAVHTREKING